MTSQPFSFQTSDDLSLYELLMLTADDLTTLDEFDAALDRVNHELASQSWLTAEERAQVSERFWAERARRIEAGRQQAVLELEAWFAGSDEAEAAPLVAGQGQQVVTLPSFFWELVLVESETDEEVERLGQRQTRSMGDDQVEVLLEQGDLDGLSVVFYAHEEAVQEGAYVDEDAQDGAWWKAQRQQVRWMDAAAKVIFSH